MPSEQPQLKVRSGQRIFGPLTLADLAELLAAGRFSEADQISDDNVRWMSIKDYVARQTDESPAPPPAATSDDGFTCIPGPISEPVVQEPSERPPLSADDDPEIRPSTAGSGSDYVLDSEPSASAYRISRQSPDSNSYAIPRHLRRDEPPSSGIPVDKPMPNHTQSVDGSVSLPDEIDLDSALEALAEDEIEAPELKKPSKPRRKRVRPAKAKRTKRKPKHR